MGYTPRSDDPQNGDDIDFDDGYVVVEESDEDD